MKPAEADRMRRDLLQLEAAVATLRSQVIGAGLLDGDMQPVPMGGRVAGAVSTARAASNEVGNVKARLDKYQAEQERRWKIAQGWFDRWGALRTLWVRNDEELARLARAHRRALARIRALEAKAKPKARKPAKGRR